MAPADFQGAGVEVEISPANGARFSTTHSGRGDESDIGSECRVDLDRRLEETSDDVDARWVLLALRLRGWRGELGDVAADESPLLGLVERGAENGVRLADRGSRKSAIDERVVEAVDVERGQLRESGRPEDRRISRSM